LARIYLDNLSPQWIEQRLNLTLLDFSDLEGIQTEAGIEEQQHDGAMAWKVEGRAPPPEAVATMDGRS
jgi:hypothetical protein